MPKCPSWLKNLIKLTFVAFFSGTALVLAAILYLSPQLPAVEQLRDVPLKTPLKVYSSDGKLIGEFGEEKRTPIRFAQIPDDYVNALLAAEDDNFFNHNGVDLFGLLRAVSQIITTGDIQSGGSTITMQVARNFFLTLDQTFIRKFNEILLAVQIEHELSKQEILELYANKMYLGKRAYGIQAAANVYYGKNIDELDLAQLAMISGLYKWPSTKNPINDPESAIIRRDWILGRMRLLDYIDEDAYQTALEAPVTAQQYGSVVEVDATYVAEMVRSEMYTKHGPEAYTEGFVVMTTVDSASQKAADNAVLNGVQQYDQRHGYRGPEATVGLELAENNEALTSYLAGIPKVANLTPAVVTEVAGQTAIIFVRDHGYVELSWDQGLSEAAPFMTHSWTGDPPTEASDVLRIGDVIRVTEVAPEIAETASAEDTSAEDTPIEKQWRLSQVPAAQAGLVALDPQNGAIRALTGGFDFYHNRFNRIMSAKRQPGSNLKPFLYATALEHDFTAATTVNDAPIVFDDVALEGRWRPENDSGKFYGPTRLRQALYASRNLVSIRILRALGVEQTREDFLRYGFEKEDLPSNLTLALGSQALEPIKVARAYAAFANGGYLIEPYFIDEIRDRHGEVMFKANPPIVCEGCEEEREKERARLEQELAEKNIAEMMDSYTSTEQPGDELVSQSDEQIEDDIAEPEPVEPVYAEQILDPRIHFIMDSILKDVIARGTGTKAQVLGRSDIAGKTGTTNGPRDAWFSGYSPNLVATTWLGFDDNSMLGGAEFGGTAALPIWIDFMAEALEGVPEKYFRQPEGLVITRINAETGERATPQDSNAIFEFFLKENTPPLTAEMSGERSTDSTIRTEDIF